MVEILCMKVMETRMRFESVTKCICRSISFKRNAFVGQWGFSFKPFLFQLWKLIWLKWQTNFNHGITLVTSEHVFVIIVVITLVTFCWLSPCKIAGEQEKWEWWKILHQKLGEKENWLFPENWASEVIGHLFDYCPHNKISALTTKTTRNYPTVIYKLLHYSKISSDRHNHVHVGKMKEKANTRHHQPIVDNTKTRQSASLKTRFSVVAIIDDLCNCIMRFTMMMMMMPR